MKKLTAYKFLQLLIISQLKETKSLTQISKRLKDKEELQVQLAFDTISTSQLARKLGDLPPTLFEKIFHYLVLNIQAKMKQSPIIREIGRLHVIDSTTMSMSVSQYPWATFRKTKAGNRLHLRIVATKELTLTDKGIHLPVKHTDSTQMGDLMTSIRMRFTCLTVAISIIKQFDHLCLHDVRFITRLKKNTQVEVLSEQIPQAGSPIASYLEVFLGNSQNGTKMIHPLCLMTIAG